jgi:hypothetical protein
VDFVWLDFTALHRHLFVDVTVTSAHTNSSAHEMDYLLHVHGSLATGAQQGKQDVDLRTSASLGTPSLQSVHHDYYPFALEDGGRLAVMAVELIACLNIKH